MFLPRPGKCQDENSGKDKADQEEKIGADATAAEVMNADPADAQKGECGCLCCH